MATPIRLRKRKEYSEEVPTSILQTLPLWQLDIGEVTGHNLEARGREEVNRLLDEGWLLLHIYTLKYQEDGTWRERPMAILGRLRKRPRPTSLAPQPTRSVVQETGDLLPSK